MKQLTSGPFATLQRFSWIFPLGIVVLIPALCVGFYAYSLHRKQLEPVFPFVSDTGGVLPQANYFSQILDICAILVFFSAIARFRQLRYLIDNNFISNNNDNTADPVQRPKLHKYNKIALILNSLAAFFLIMVGNYRTTESNRIHTFSAFSMIALQLVYFSYQAYISKQLYRSFGVETKPISLVIFTIFGAFSYIVCFFANFMSILQFGEEKFSTDNEARLHWNEYDPGYMAHIYGTVTEWISLNTFPLLYFCLFRRMKAFSKQTKTVNNVIYEQATATTRKNSVNFIGP